ncbi:MAG: sulfite exporter TauE/SafE family protein [Pseudomonadota bacterium]
MDGINLVPVFLVGLLGSVHCIGMCGGIVAAFSAAPAPQRNFPVAVAAYRAPALGAVDGALRVLSYNTGRIASYVMAGAIAGGIAGGARALTGISTLQVGGYWLANLMLVALGLYLMDVWRGLARLEAAGHVVWRHIAPLMKPLLPMDSPLKALALGGIWGWLPCGMVYSVLLTAIMSGSALSGAAVMLAFGLGTLPMLLAMGLLGTHMKGWARRRSVRVAGGLLVLAFGIAGLARTWHGLSLGWLEMLCLTPS